MTQNLVGPIQQISNLGVLTCKVKKFQLETDNDLWPNNFNLNSVIIVISSLLCMLQTILLCSHLLNKIKLPLVNLVKLLMPEAVYEDFLSRHIE